MATGPRQRPPGQFSGRFILVIVGLVIVYALTMWAALAAAKDRLAVERGLTVAEVETRAGMRRGFLSPVDGSKLRVTGIAAVAGVLGVKAGEIVEAAGQARGR
jgi:hypothetical protein